jgi:N-acetylglucosamine-6-sulfatase
MNSPRPGLLFALAILVAAAAARPALADECRGDLLELQRGLRESIRCEQKTLRRHGRCAPRLSTCTAEAAAPIVDLLFGEASVGAAREASRKQLSCQLGVAHASRRYLETRIRDRRAGRRRARGAAILLDRIEDRCGGVRAGTTLPRFGAPCDALIGVNEEIPADELGRCLRASLERIVDDAAPKPLAPNIVLVLTDDQRPETLDFMPAIDRLAAEGIVFENAFATTSVCTPSRASIFSGLYAHHHGSTSNRQDFDDSDTLAPWLSARGYRTGFFGKYRNDTVPAPHVPPGWDEWQAFTDVPDAPPACPGGGNCFYDYALNENGELVFYGSDEESYSTDLLAGRVEDFIETNDDVPFFAVYSPTAPHLPATPAPRHAGLYADLEPWRPPSWDAGALSTKPSWVRFARFLFGVPQKQETDNRRIREIESLLAVDEALASLLDTLERRGLRDHTIVLFTSDHGIHWGEHGWTSKLTSYEESIRIPFLLSYPLRAPLPEVRSEMVLTIDIAPTLAEATGADTARVDGESLMGLLDGDATWRGSFLVENFIDFVARPSTAVRTERWKYIETSDTEGVVEELYDLAVDPYELENLAFDPTYQIPRALLARRLAELREP